MEGPPPAPIPALPVDFPLPSLGRGRRPGVITAIGVISIVVGSLGILANIGSGISVTAMYVLLRAAGTRPYPPPTIVMVQPAQPPADAFDSINGMPSADRQLVVNALAGLKPMNTARRRQLDALLAQAGKTMFPTPEAEALTVAEIRGNISEKGIAPSARAGQGPHFFVIGQGRIEIYDDHAVFRPMGSSDVVSVSAADASDAEAGTNGGPVGSVAPGGSARPPLLPSRATTSRRLKFNAEALLLSIVEMVASGVLAIYLLVIGIMVLRDSPRGRRLHWIYVAIKIPLALLSGAAGWWFAKSFMSAMASIPGPPVLGVSWSMAISAAVATGLALIYPMALIFALNGKSAREYYGSVRESLT